MKNVKIYPVMSTRSGKVAANQYEIYTSDGRFFQSYSTVCAKIDQSGQVYIRSGQPQSVTTARYLYQFLGDDKKVFDEKIKNGEYKVVEEL